MTFRQGKRSAGHRCCQDSRRRHHDVGCHQRGCSEVCDPSRSLTVGFCGMYTIVVMISCFLVLSSRELLEKELESVGIRLNRNKPNIYFKVQFYFSFAIFKMCHLKYISAELYEQIIFVYCI